MDVNLLALYLKLNLLLAVAFLLWQLTKFCMRHLRIAVSHARQLTIARLLFISLLLVVPGILLFQLLMPGWFAGIATVLQQELRVGEITIVAGLDKGLEQQFMLGGRALTAMGLLAVLLLAGLALQLVRLAMQVNKLRRIVNGAVEWKCIGPIHILFSPAISSPFSTSVLGSNHVVLPYQLLDSPRNLRLAVKHELQHLRNGDLQWVVLLEAVKVLCFWNPAVYLWHNEFDCLQEFACDEVLIQERLVSSQAYGSCLLEVASASAGVTLLASSNMVPTFALFSNNHSQLKRRILMLTNKSNNTYAGLKSLAYGVLVSVGLISSALVVFAADTAAQDAGAAQASSIPVYRLNPEYPASALEQKQVGWVQLQYTIDEKGGVLDPVVVKNCVRQQTAAEATCVANDTFDSATLAALVEWKFEPRVENGVAVKVEGVQAIIRFELEDTANNAEPVEQ